MQGFQVIDLKLLLAPREPIGTAIEPGGLERQDAGREPNPRNFLTNNIHSRLSFLQFRTDTVLIDLILIDPKIIRISFVANVRLQ